MEIYLNIAEWGPGIYGIEGGCAISLQGACLEAYAPPGIVASRFRCRSRSIAMPENPDEGCASMRRSSNGGHQGSGDYIKCIYG